MKHKCTCDSKDPRRLSDRRRDSALLDRQAPIGLRYSSIVLTVILACSIFLTKFINQDYILCLCSISQRHVMKGCPLFRKYPLP